MTIENDLNRIASALEAIATTLSAETVTPVPVQQNTLKPAETHVAPADTPTLTGTILPFKDVPGLVSYTMGAYQKLGPEKGSRIQGILSGLGYDNINNVKPEHFTSFFNQIEALVAGS